MEPKLLILVATITILLSTPASITVNGFSTSRLIAARTKNNDDDNTNKCSTTNTALFLFSSVAINKDLDLENAFHSSVCTTTTTASPTTTTTNTVITSSTSDEFLECLITNGRMIDSPLVQDALRRLTRQYYYTTDDARTTSLYDGDWITETLPTFPNMLGVNEFGQSRYKLGRLTFSMIRPGNLICAIRKITQHVHKVFDDEDCDDHRPSPSHHHHQYGNDFGGGSGNSDDDSLTLTTRPRRKSSSSLDLSSLNIPPNMREEVEKNPYKIRTYRTDVHFTLEESGVKGVLQMDGYTIPHPTKPNMYKIWFSGGRCYALEGQNVQQWRDIFGGTINSPLPKLTLREQLQRWMVRFMMGGETSDQLLEDGSLAYTLTRSIVGYHQVLFLNDDVRVTEGNLGTVVVASRI